MTKLPKLYTNKFDKKIDNSLDFVRVNESIEKISSNKFDIKKKIDSIFKSTKYIYKIKVDITLKDKLITKVIIGKTRDNLITIDNELISIDDIVNIKQVD